MHCIRAQTEVFRCAWLWHFRHSQPAKETAKVRSRLFWLFSFSPALTKLMFSTAVTRWYRGLRSAFEGAAMTRQNVKRIAFDPSRLCYETLTCVLTYELHRAKNFNGTCPYTIYAPWTKDVRFVNFPSLCLIFPVSVSCRPVIDNGRWTRQ